MPTDALEFLDVWRMLAARREFRGRVALAKFERLRSALADDAGEVSYCVSFDRDSLNVPYVEVQVQAQLPLLCQRSLQVYLQPMQICQRLGLLRDEADEAALPAGYEPLLVPDDGRVQLLGLIEDELILATPVIPAAPGTDTMQHVFAPDANTLAQASPFAALSALKTKR